MREQGIDHAPGGVAGLHRLQAQLQCRLLEVRGRGGVQQLNELRGSADAPDAPRTCTSCASSPDPSVAIAD